MGKQLKKAFKDRSAAEEETRAKQKRTSDLAKALSALQGQRRTSEQLWAKEMSRLRGQLLVQQQ